MRKTSSERRNKRASQGRAERRGEGKGGEEKRGEGKAGEEKRREEKRRKDRSEGSTTRLSVPKSRWADPEATREGPGPVALCG